MTSKMTPTAKFRWLEFDFEWNSRKEHPSFIPVPGTVGARARVLQQWWEDDNYEINGVPKHSGEWRDIPVKQA